MMITEMLARNARMYGNEIALVEREPEKNKRREITWQEFDDQSHQLAQSLLKKGVKKGDRVVLLMRNCLEWLPIYFGILRTGALAVPLNFRFAAKTIKHCTETAGANFFILGEEFVDRINSIHKDLDNIIDAYIFIGPEDIRPDFAEPYREVLATQKPVDPRIDIDITDDSGLYFTSGTTGLAKGVLLTHRNLEFACFVENRHHFQTHRDNFLCLPPLYHTGAKMHWFGNLMVGARGVILKGVTPQWILETISEEKVTVVWLMVKGPGVMKRYHNNPEATEAALIDGWLLTGDVVKQDESGFIWLVDRKKDVVITGGENIYPVEIEDFLQAHPAIQDVAVIGVPDMRLGEISAAVVQTKPSQELGEEEINRFCQGLPRYKRPRKIFFSRVPRNPTGKIEKLRLRKQFGGTASNPSG